MAAHGFRLRGSNRRVGYLGDRLGDCANENPGVEFFLEKTNADIAEPYEVIFIAGGFHHIPLNERAGVMKMLYHRLTPGGLIVIFEHNPFNPVTQRIVSNCLYDRDSVLLKPSDLKALLIDADLAMCCSGYCLFVPPSISLLLPLEARLGWLPLGG